MSAMLLMFGVSFTNTGTSATSLTHSVIILVYSGTWPTAAPIPRSLMPCGQPKFNSTPSQPVSLSSLMAFCHVSFLDSTISETTTTFFGYFFFVSLISRMLVSHGRAVMSSMLLKPIMRVGTVIEGPEAGVDVDDRVAERFPHRATPAEVERALDLGAAVGGRSAGEPEWVG